MNTKHQVKHKYHLVDPSPLPLMAAVSLLILVIGAVMFMHGYRFGTLVFGVGFSTVLAVMGCWWKTVIKEGRTDHAHTHVVRRGLSLGMLLFIVSEVMFFFVFFWSFFNSSLFPADVLGGETWAIKKGVWPPEGIKTLDPWNIPFLNTLILLLSGTTVTWAHYSLIANNQKDLKLALLITVLLGLLFSLFQVYEYYHAEFHWKDGIFASNFYMVTGFHGFHVLVGTIFLFVCLLRAKQGHFTKGHGHLGFEFAAWYWHFVDVVWLFLFVFVYVWGR